MQRGGAWDDSDLLKNKKDTQVVKRTKVVTNDVFSKKIEKKKWSNLDKEYASVSHHACANGMWPSFVVWDSCCVDAYGAVSRAPSVLVMFDCLVP